MEKHSKKLEYKVGMFVGVGLVAMMLSILLLGGNRVFFTRYANFKTPFVEVQGLFPGSVVSLAGLPVGNVTEIVFSTEANQLEVHYTVDYKFLGRVTNGSKAEIRTQGALGDKYIYITPGPVTAGSIGDNQTIPPDASGDLFSMLTDKEDGIGNVVTLIKELSTLVHSLNSDGKVIKTMTNITTATGQLTETLEHLDALINDMRGGKDDKQLQKAIQSLSSVMTKIDKGQGTLGALINDPSLHQALKAYLGSSPRNSYLKNVIRETIQKSEAKR